VLERPGDWENEGRRRWMRDVGLGLLRLYTLDGGPTGYRVWGRGERIRTRFTRWVRKLPINRPVGGNFAHTHTLIGFLPAG
jgi:hypothetical protein